LIDGAIGDASNQLAFNILQGSINPVKRPFSQGEGHGIDREILR